MAGLIAVVVVGALLLALCCWVGSRARAFEPPVRGSNGREYWGGECLS